MKPNQPVTWFRRLPRGGAISCAPTPAVFLAFTKKGWVKIRAKHEDGIERLHTINPEWIEEVKS